jgi:SAM-dependent methyltransferase
VAPAGHPDRESSILSLAVEPRVRDAMSSCHLLLDEGDLLADALEAIERLGIGGTVIDADGNLIGLLLRRDARHALRDGSSASLTVGEVTARRLSVGPDDSLRAALAAMEAAHVGYLPVVNGRTPVGGIGMNDIDSYLHMLEQREKLKRLGQKLEPRRRSRVRWREAVPDHGLTWGRELSGEAFITKAESYGAFVADKAILEIGPGYGRLLRECLRRKLPFRKYVAVDISPSNAKYLAMEFKRADVQVIVGDIETVTLEERFDVVLSSLTLKHLYPSVETALRNVARHLNGGAAVIFDLMEGTFRGFSSHDGLTYIREYSRAQLREILSRIPLDLVAFDEVEHDPEWARLLVVARKPVNRSGLRSSAPGEKGIGLT